MNELAQAVEILRAGGLVAFPTETVYGLGADATNPAAVRKIFDAKGRPAINPLIAHVADEQIARRFAERWPPAAQALARRYWPGPLTLVVPKAPSIADETTAGRSTVALRAPDHPLAMQLLREFDGAIAAPSANRSTHISPTTAQHVREELADRVDLILDGGPCRIGIESTVLDLSGSTPTVLRPGAITRREIEEQIGAVAAFAGSVDLDAPAQSPGMQAVHYAPRTPAIRFAPEELPLALQSLGKGLFQRVAYLWLGQSKCSVKAHWVRAMPALPDQYARQLYSALREADGSGAEVIAVEMPPERAEWVAVRDRLLRATHRWNGLGGK